MLTAVKSFMANEASIGIGSLIIFVAMMLVAGIAATVVIQTMNSMQQQALETSRETIRDIANGIEVTRVSGKINGGNITQMAIFVSPVVGSDAIDLIQSHIDLSNTVRKVILYYDSNHFNDSLSIVPSSVE